MNLQISEFSPQSRFANAAKEALSTNFGYVNNPNLRRTGLEEKWEPSRLQAIRLYDSILVYTLEHGLEPLLDLKIPARFFIKGRAEIDHRQESISPLRNSGKGSDFHDRGRIVQHALDDLFGPLDKERLQKHLEQLQSLFLTTTYPIDLLDYVTHELNIIPDSNIPG